MLPEVRALVVVVNRKLHFRRLIRSQPIRRQFAMLDTAIEAPNEMYLCPAPSSITSGSITSPVRHAVIRFTSGATAGAHYLPTAPPDSRS